MPEVGLPYTRPCLGRQARPDDFFGTDLAPNVPSDLNGIFTMVNSESDPREMAPTGPPALTSGRNS